MFLVDVNVCYIVSAIVGIGNISFIGVQPYIIIAFITNNTNNNINVITR